MRVHRVVSASEKTMATNEAESTQRTFDGEPIDHPRTRKSYIRARGGAFLLREHNLYQTAKRFALNTKNVFEDMVTTNYTLF